LGELVKFTQLTRETAPDCTGLHRLDCTGYLVDRYSERRERARALPRRRAAFH